VISPSLFLPSSSLSPSLATQSPTITAPAPLSCAALTLVAKSHAPLSTSAILYGLDGLWNRIGGQAGEMQAMSG
jgi:hypothetical protein